MLGEEAERVGRVGADLLVEHDERGGFERVGQPFSVERRFGSHEKEDAPAVGGQSLEPGAHRIVDRALEPHHVGRADDPRPLVGERSRAPLAGRRERHRAITRPSRRSRERLAERLHRGVAVLIGRKGTQRVGDHVVMPERLERVELHHALGQRARLVEHHDVDARQAFDRGKLLYQHPPARERDRRDREREARQQHQSFRDHCDHTGDHTGDGVPVRVGRGELAECEQDRRREERVLHELQDAIRAVHELGVHEREATCFGGEAPRVGIGADPRRLETARARHHDAPRQHLVAGLLAHRLRLTREQRLVELETVGGTRDPVGHELVARPDLEQVVEHHVGDRNLPYLPVAHHAGARRRHDGEAVEGSLGPPLLADTEQGVDDQHEAEKTVLRGAEHEDQHEHGRENRVEARQEIRARDLTQRTARALVGGIDQPASHTIGDLGRGEPFRPGVADEVRYLTRCRRVRHGRHRTWRGPQPCAPEPESRGPNTTVEQPWPPAFTTKTGKRAVPAPGAGGRRVPIA